MGGLARICKMYGGMKVKGSDGKEIEYIYDYVNDKPRIKSEMTKEEITAIEKAKWEGIIKTLKQSQQ